MSVRFNNKDYPLENDSSNIHVLAVSRTSLKKDNMISTGRNQSAMSVSAAAGSASAGSSMLQMYGSDSNVSLQTQSAHIDEYCKKLFTNSQYTIENLNYNGLGIGVNKPNRMLQQIQYRMLNTEKIRPTHIVFFATSRFCKSLHAFEEFILFFLGEGIPIQIHFSNEPIGFINITRDNKLLDTEVLNITKRIIVHESESRDKSNYAIEQIASKKKAGWMFGQAPFGKRAQKDRKGVRKFYGYKPEMKALSIIKSKINSRFSWIFIANELNMKAKNGLCSSYRGKVWTGNNVKYIYNKYIGMQSKQVNRLTQDMDEILNLTTQKSRTNQPATEYNRTFNPPQVYNSETRDLTRSTRLFPGTLSRGSFDSPGSKMW